MQKTFCVLRDFSDIGYSDLEEELIIRLSKEFGLRQTKLIPTADYVFVCNRRNNHSDFKLYGNIENVVSSSISNMLIDIQKQKILIALNNKRKIFFCYKKFSLEKLSIYKINIKLEGDDITLIEGIAGTTEFCEKLLKNNILDMNKEIKSAQISESDVQQHFESDVKETVKSDSTDNQTLLFLLR